MSSSTTYDCVVGISDKVRARIQVHIAVPHGGHNMFFKDKAGNWWSTIFGGDRLAPLEQRRGLLRVEFAPPRPATSATWTGAAWACATRKKPAGRMPAAIGPRRCARSSPSLPGARPPGRVQGT